jgi:hypothetical protein
MAAKQLPDCNHENRIQIPKDEMQADQGFSIYFFAKKIELTKLKKKRNRKTEDAFE